YLLILAAFDGTSPLSHISAELRQRGIEGLIVVGAGLPREGELPVASVDLECFTAREPLADEARTWLTDLGESAVEAVIRMIETKAAPRKANIIPNFPPAYADLPGFDLSTAGLELQREVRDAS